MANMTSENSATNMAHDFVAAIRPGVSGLYRWSPTPYSIRAEELRLDVDGDYPQSVASGVIRASSSAVVNWVANLVSDGADVWTGPIWYKHGKTSLLQHDQIVIRVTRSSTSAPHTATVEFSGGGIAQSRELRYRSRYFHPVNFEFDVVEDELATHSMETCAHPNRPATLPCETLTIQKVFQRAGFDASRSSSGNRVPLGLAGGDRLWSDQEMHDAMQAYWSKFSSRAKWALWVFFAALHEADPTEPGDRPENLGGIMFDSIGANHRQGTAIFVDSFISKPRASDPDPDAWTRRMIFWCACHEMGHAFNLAHSWQKGLGGGWIELEHEPEARSFMNYPYFVAGGETAFFDDFAYRFSDSELLFMRHAPAQFVQMGNADWFDDHAFEFAATSPDPSFSLDLRVNRDKAIFEFMEPVTLEVKLTNISSQSCLIDPIALEPGDGMTVVIKKDRRPARQYIPYARYCRQPASKVIEPGKVVYESLFISAGLNGWDLAEPGMYTIQLSVRIGEQEVVSNPLRLRVAPPQGYDEEYVAQDFFGEDVGRIIALDGSRFLNTGNDILREVSAKLSNRRVARHASLALGEALGRNFKQLVADQSTPQGLAIKVTRAQPDESRKLLTEALLERPQEMSESLGHIDYKWYVDGFSAWLAKQGNRAESYNVQDQLLNTLSARMVRGRRILNTVLDAAKARRDSYR